MAYLAARSKLRHHVRQVSSRTPLRIKLIAATLALVTVALVVISTAGIFFLRGYLLNQADAQLEHVALAGGEIRGSVISYLAVGTTGPSTGQVSLQWLPESGPVQQIWTEYTTLHDGVLSNPVPGPDAKQGASWLNQGIDHPVTVRAKSGSTRWRVVSGPISLTVNPDGRVFNGTAILGLNVTSVYKTINELTIIDLIICGVLLIVLAMLGITVIRSSLRPLNDIERTAEAIAAGELGRRVPDNDPRTEVGRLGRSLNTMLAHIEDSFRARTASEEAARRSEEAARFSALNASRSEGRMRQFVADASHELRTPLTAIRGYAEYYRQRGGFGAAAGSGAAAGGGEAADGTAKASSRNGIASAGSHQTADSAVLEGLSRADLDHLIQRVEQEAKRMGVLVDDLLLLARLDQQRPLEFRTVDLLAIAADAMQDARVIAPDRTINLTVGSPDAALVLGDEVGLRQVVGNLMSNAMTHTPGGTPVDITIRVDQLSNGRAPAGPAGPAVIVEVTDQGPGLNEDQKEHVFERFYRTDRSRSRTAGGTGLGLAIVASMVTAHNGKVWVDSSPGSGATFGFALPLAPEARLSPADDAAEHELARESHPA